MLAGRAHIQLPTTSHPTLVSRSMSCTARPLESRVMEAFKRRFNRGIGNLEFERETIESIDSARI
jgi:hypothetical protein